MSSWGNDLSVGHGDCQQYTSWPRGNGLLLGDGWYDDFA